MSPWYTFCTQWPCHILAHLGTKTSQQSLTFVHASSILPKQGHTKCHHMCSQTFSKILVHDWLEWFDCVIRDTSWHIVTHRDTSWHIVSAVPVSPGNFQPNAKPYLLPQGQGGDQQHLARGVPCRQLPRFGISLSSCNLLFESYRLYHRISHYKYIVIYRDCISPYHNHIILDPSGSQGNWSRCWFQDVSKLRCQLLSYDSLHFLFFWATNISVFPLHLKPPIGSVLLMRPVHHASYSLHSASFGCINILSTICSIWSLHLVLLEVISRMFKSLDRKMLP